MKTKRSSNIELLRVIAMLMIVAYHIYIHCISLQMTYGTNTLFCTPVVHKKLVLFALAAPLGKIGNAVFVLITGYFMVSKGKNVNLIKTSKKLILQQAFAVVTLMVSSTIVFKLFQYSDKLNPSLVNLSYFNNCSWFVGYYFIIIVFGKIFLNGFLEKQEKTGYLATVLVLFGLTQFSWCLNFFNGFSEYLGVAVTGLFLYILGGYIKRYEPFENIKTWALFLIIFLVIIFIIYSNYNQALSNISAYSGEGLYMPSIIHYADFSIIPIVAGVTLFEVFRRIRIPDCKIINYLGSATFMVYLLHDNEFAYRFWRMEDWISLLYESPVRYVLKHLEWTLITFAVGLVAYTLYLLLAKLFFVSKGIWLKNKNIKTEE